MDWILSSFDVLFDYPRWYLGAILGTGFFTYYLQHAVKQPMLACSNGKFKEFLLAHVPILQEKYWPTLWCFESRAQTVFASLLRSRLLPNIKYRREILKLADGGQVALDWLEDGCPPGGPIIIILPGLTGESQAEYVKCLVTSANRIKLRVVVFNNRGLGGISLKTPRTYCASKCDDMSEVVSHVRSLNPGIPLVAAGVSMGGLILGNYLASQHSMPDKPICAAMVISVPWNVFKGTESIEKPFLNLLLNRHLAGGLCKNIERLKRDQVPQGPWDVEEVLKSKTIREFDSSYTTKQFGYKDVESYYTEATIHDKLDKIEIPVLCLSAADDPFQPLEAIPVEEANKSKYVAIVITARGGHIGFLEGLLPLFQEEYMCRLFTQYFTSIFGEGSELFAEINKEN
ncbi:phospholipase ABHD3 [Periplaneta americana]|uniref:phospholipase ABHD3 n=1 Tax=Periplaneta americana TaxID=6978 RepID=UPI0037E9AAF4